MKSILSASLSAEYRRCAGSSHRGANGGCDNRRDRTYRRFAKPFRSLATIREEDTLVYLSRSDAPFSRYAADCAIKRKSRNSETARENARGGRCHRRIALASLAEAIAHELPSAWKLALSKLRSDDLSNIRNARRESTDNLFKEHSKLLALGKKEFG